MYVCIYLNRVRQYNITGRFFFHSYTNIADYLAGFILERKIIKGTHDYLTGFIVEKNKICEVFAC